MTGGRWSNSGAVGTRGKGSNGTGPMSAVNAPCRSLVHAHATRSLIGARHFRSRGVGLGHPFHARFPLRTASKRRGSTVRPIFPRHWCKSAHRSARARRRYTPEEKRCREKRCREKTCQEPFSGVYGESRLRSRRGRSFRPRLRLGATFEGLPVFAQRAGGSLAVEVGDLLLRRESLVFAPDTVLPASDIS